MIANGDGWWQPGCAVFVMTRGSFLLTRRSFDKGSDGGGGMWSVPGGKLEKGESWQDAGAREVLEETGLTIGKPSLLTVTTCRDPGCGWMTIWMRADRLHGSLILQPGEVIDAVAARGDSLFSYPLWDDQWDPFFKETGTGPNKGLDLLLNGAV